ncbi:hypothetical protein [Herbaspirillum huttiense]|uniref:Uncharacterized protein n=1 Tax=Herbaspirillum huttiense subsp. lycopersici TaxID=3074428 RepID=A0ABU2EFX5_9BURK|nr:hypothetical protein [Herbaspirillum huttiense]MDR9847030.1 hypothetical protein [Herbaspirillum huttiense SE1]
MEAQRVGADFEPGILASVRIGNLLGLDVIPNFCDDLEAGKAQLGKLAHNYQIAKTVGGESVVIFVRDLLIGVTRPFPSEANAVASALEFLLLNK